MTMPAARDVERGGQQLSSAGARRIGLAVAAFAALAAAACRTDISTEREPVDTGTFGETVATLLCKRVAYLEDRRDGDGVVDVRGDTYRELCRSEMPAPEGAPENLRAFQAARPQLVSTLDTLFPEPLLRDVQALLTSEEVLSLYDDGILASAVGNLSTYLHDLADAPGFAPAIARLERRPGYVPEEAALGLVRAFVAYPELHEFLGASSRAMAPGGGAHEELLELSRGLSASLRASEPVAAPASPDRTGKIAVDLLLTERDRLGTSRTIPLVRRDHRGLARVRPTEDGALPAPFVDVDGDGLADANDAGRFVTSGGEPVLEPTPFVLPSGDGSWPHRDTHDRALASAQGEPVYDYVDLDDTLLGALLRDGIDLFDPQKGTAIDLLRGMSVLLGPRETSARAYGGGAQIAYRGYDTSESALLDMFYGYLQILASPAADDLLALVRQLVTERESEVARLAEAVIGAVDLGDQFPDAALAPDSTLYADLVPIVRAILADRDLTVDLLDALARPETVELGRRLSDYMLYKDRFAYEPGTNEVLGRFGTPVDRSSPDSGENRSIMQRLVHTIHDTAGLRLCNKQGAVIRIPGTDVPILTYDECEMVSVDDAAVLYLRSMAYARDDSGNILLEDGEPVPAASLDLNFQGFGDLISDDLIASVAGIEGLGRNPTPEALNRLLFLDPAPAFVIDAFGEIRCADDHLYTRAHAGTIQAWELNGFYDQIQPVAQAFVDHGAEDLFVDLIEVLHDHWPSRESADHQQSDPRGIDHAFASNIAGYEPVVAEVLRRGDLLGALGETLPVLRQEQANGRSFDDILRDTALHLLTPRPNVTDRRGNDRITSPDGRPVTSLSPWHVIADGYRRKSRLFAAHPEEAEAWDRATGQLVDMLMRGESVGGDWRFRNPRFVGVAVTLIDFLQDRLAAHDEAGDRVTWIRGELPGDVEDLLTGPIVAAAGDFALALHDSLEARHHLEKLSSYLVDEVGHGDTFRTTLIAVADLLQLALDDRNMVPIARAVGEGLRPERELLSTHLEFVERARAADEYQVFVTILRTLYSRASGDETVLARLLDSIVDVQRARPYADRGKRLTVEDYRSAMHGVADFLGDNRRGFQKFVAIVEGREL